MICPYCTNPAKWAENKVIYGKNYGRSFMCWVCLDCNAYVGCHSNTQRPLGTMANKELRAWRMKAHATFDPVWRNGRFKRSQAYAMLNNFFKKEVHIGASDQKMCEEIIKSVPIIFKEYYVV